MVAVCTWLARTSTLLVLLLRSAADAESKLDTLATVASPLRQALANLGVGTGVEERERRLQAQSQPIDVIAVDTLQSVPMSKCSQNTFFLDWGSSGMKVHAVHRSPGVGLETKDVKIVGLSPKVDEPQLLAILGNLSAKLTAGHVGGAALATAGFRLLPTEAAATWQRVRRWNARHNLLQNCSLADNAGCRTLPGSDEADYEMQGMIDSVHRHGGKLGSRFGMASCGGASIQLAFWGLPKNELADCVRDLRGFSSEYDKARIRLGVKRQAAWFSWLANHRLPLSIIVRSDYTVGGVDEMRGRYDTWLEIQQGSAATNPCVSSEADAYFRTGGKCVVFAGKNRSCLLDRWGSYITRLKGRPDSTREICRESIAVFLQEDQMLSMWHTSSSCRALTMQTPEWNFLTAFSRPTQLGADLRKATTWSEVKQCIKKFGATPMFESRKDLEDQMPGEYLTSALLIGFLDRLGLNDNATIRPSKGDVAETSMKHFGLSKGWVSEEDPFCVRPKTTTTLPASGSCTLPPTLQVMGPRLRQSQGHYKPSATIMVTCAPGYKASQPSWSLTCVQGDWKDAANPKSMANTSTMCAKVTCDRPMIEFGVWIDHPGVNQTFQLQCNSGFKPTDGPSILTCTDGGSFQSFARCTSVGDAGAWRSSNIIAPGFVDFIFLAAIAAALVLFYQRRFKQASRVDQQESRPFVPAEHEME